MKGVLDYINKKALKETYNTIFEIEDDSEERSKRLVTPITKEEIDDMRRTITAKCIDSEDVNMMFLFIRKELDNYQKKKELTERHVIIFNTLIVENYRKITNYMLEEIFHIKNSDVIEKAFRTLYNFTKVYKGYADKDDRFKVSKEDIELFNAYKEDILDTMSTNTFKTFALTAEIKII